MAGWFARSTGGASEVGALLLCGVGQVLKVDAVAECFKLSDRAAFVLAGIRRVK